MRNQSITVRKLKKLLLILTIGLTSGAFSCPIKLPPPPAFSQGIRIKTFENLAGNPDPNKRVPVPGVANNGNLTQRYGTGTGFQIGTAGTTNFYAISDYPNAVTNSQWNQTVNYGAVIPRCGRKTQSFYIPYNGAIIEWTCVFLFFA